MIDCVEEYKNLFLVGAVRCDTAIFDLPPPHDGKRGRPRKYGEKLNIRELEYEEVDGYHGSFSISYPFMESSSKARSIFGEKF